MNAYEVDVGNRSKDKSETVVRSNLCVDSIASYVRGVSDEEQWRAYLNLLHMTEEK